MLVRIPFLAFPMNGLPPTAAGSDPGITLWVEPRYSKRPRRSCLGKQGSTFCCVLVGGTDVAADEVTENNRNHR